MVKLINKKLIIIYDGECIFCNNLSKLTKIRSKIKNVEILNARDLKNEIVFKFKKKYNFDEGMLVIFKDKEYYGSKAINFLSSIEYDALLPKIIYFPFRNLIFSKFAYPILKFGRYLFLKLRGKDLIGY